MADDIETPAQVHDCEPDPSGDLILKVGTPQQETRIRVSSKVMTLASPVLAAMLSPKYREGRTLSDHGFLELALPEDDPEAMVWVCKAFHMKQSLSSISLQLMEKLVRSFLLIAGSISFNLQKLKTRLQVRMPLRLA